ncbi:hypothetical protein KXS07_30290 [Inquilinus limosus]|uniref:hypothetical protein n=1 Tax=Inquilinus limosus TaxID=171674 RepID=UPI003F163FA7
MAPLAKSNSSPAPSNTAKPSTKTPVIRRIASTISPTPKKWEPAHTTNVPAMIASVSGFNIDSTVERASAGKCGSDRRIASATLSADDIRAMSILLSMDFFSRRIAPRP